MFEKLTLDKKPLKIRDYYHSNTTFRHRILYQSTVQESTDSKILSPVNKLTPPKTLKAVSPVFDSVKFKISRQQLNLNNMMIDVQNIKSYKSSYFNKGVLKREIINLDLTSQEEVEQTLTTQPKTSKANVSSLPSIQPTVRVRQGDRKIKLNITSRPHRHNSPLRQMGSRDMLYSPKNDIQRRLKTEQFKSEHESIKMQRTTFDEHRDKINHPQSLIGDSANLNQSQQRREPFKSKLIECDPKFEEFERKKPKSLFDLIKKNLFKLIKFRLLNPQDFWAKKIFSETAYEKIGSYELIQAVRRNKVVTATELLHKNLYLVFDYDHLFMTALHWACKKGHMACVKLLLPYDPDLDAEDFIGRTPLYHAFENNHNEVAQELLLNKASPWSTGKLNYCQLYESNPGCKQILSTRRKIDILLLMTPHAQRDKIWIDFSLQVLLRV